jgi:hypothetical protein
MFRLLVKQHLIGKAPKQQKAHCIFAVNVEARHNGAQISMRANGLAPLTCDYLMQPTLLVFRYIIRMEPIGVA